MNKNIFKGAGVVVLLVVSCTAVALLILLLTDSKPADTHKAMYEQLQAEHKKVLNDRDGGLHLNDSLTKEIVRLKANEARLKTQISIYRSDLDRTLKEAVKYADIITKTRSDSSERDIACDELVDQVNAFATLYVHYRDLSDSLTMNADSAKASYQLANDNMQVLFNNLSASYDRLYSSYVSLIADQTTLQKSLRRQKLKTKVAIVLGILGTGAALIK
jgi:septal ring factor EnvC (AmiA/AmiB activator)